MKHLVSTSRALASIVLVSLVIGAALGTIFWQLMAFERASNDMKAYWIWVAEWVGFDLFLTLFLCRQEIRYLIRGKNSG